MTVLKEGSSLKREIRIPNIDSPVQVEITSKGLSFWVKGSKKRVSNTWFHIVQGCHTEMSVASFLMGKPIELLIHQASKATKRGK